MKTARLILLSLLCSVLALSLLFFGYCTLTEYRPKPIEVIYTASPNEQPIPLRDTLTVVSWNIGYGGLGEGMDFFTDGGVRVRESRAQSEANLEAILTELQAIDADVMLLQEVDLRSKRSYGVDQCAVLQEHFPHHTLLFAYNYLSRYIPVPLGDPLGRVEAGLAILTRATPLRATRYAYPSSFDYPMRLFNLKRALLTAEFLTLSGDTILLGNTHNTAFDTGEMRTQENHFLNQLLIEEQAYKRASIIGGDWNQLPPRYIPSLEELSNPYFTPEPLVAESFEADGEFVYDTHAPSMRFMDHPLDSTSVRSLTDFFWVSRGVRILSIETLPLEFKHSDHNPVIIRLLLPESE